MLPTLTEREKRILYYIRLFQFKYRYSPSTGDVGTYFGVGKQTIGQVFRRLRKKGYVEVSNQKAWQHRVILMPKDTTFNWGSEELPDELFDHMRKSGTMEFI